jgi:hypothetical protein
VARRKKPDVDELTPMQLKVKRAIINEQADNSVVRDAFLEGRDKLAIETLREMDGRGHLRAAAGAIKRAQERLRSMPPTCYGAIAQVNRAHEDLGFANAHMDRLPDEWRRTAKGAPTLFGRRNIIGNQLTKITQELQNNCGGTNRAFPMNRPDPRDGTPSGDVPLEGQRKKKRR